MPKCRKCANTFPNRITIDGKVRVLGNRKFCLDCSPYGLHNTRPVLDETNGKIRICPHCNREFDSTRRRVCNSCFTKNRRDKMKAKSVEYKGGKCVACGYNRCLDSLAFHHLDPTEKKFGIGGKYSMSWDSLKAELDKCVLLCNNCHGEYHAGMLNF